MGVLCFAAENHMEDKCEIFTWQDDSELIIGPMKKKSSDQNSVMKLFQFHSQNYLKFAFKLD